MNRVGVEKINLYGCSLCLDQARLAEARGLDPDRVVRDYLIDTRSLNPPYEDAVTMGANAAKPVVDSVDADKIGMLIVGTEGSVDFGKPMSTNIHGALGLHPKVRNYETKHACYSGVAALDTAVNWVASGLNAGRTGLVIATDFSRMHLDTREEFVMGGVAVALLVSERPAVIEYELEKRGTWTTDVYDTFRPSARDEVGNNEVSLYSYLDAIEGSFEDYRTRLDDQFDFDKYFTHLVYHTPFAGMAFQAHRTLCNISRRRSKAEVRESFEQRVMPALRYARRVGSTYGASNFAGICSLIASVDDLRPGSRVGFYAYGSGAIGEFYSGLICEGAKQAVDTAGIDAALDSRRSVTVAEYESIEQEREAYIERPSFEPNLAVLDNWYADHYEGKGLLALKRVEDFYRTYEWS